MTNLTKLHQEYHHVFPIVVKWGEMDAFSHVNNTVFIRYLEDARIQLLTSLGMEEEMRRTNIGPIFASVTCNYLAPITFPDTVHVATKVKQTGPKKIELKQIIYSEKLNKTAATATSLCVYYDYSKLTSCDLSESMENAIQRLNEIGNSTGQ